MHKPPEDVFFAARIHTGASLCHRYHLTAATTSAANAEIHCPHAQKEATAFCKTPPTKYETFCSTYKATCGTDGVAFADDDACVNYMATLADGDSYTAPVNADGDGETFNCKQCVQ